MKLVLILFLGVYLFAEQTLNVQVGDKTIKIPEYNNMVDLSQIKELNKFIQKSGGTGNKVLAALYEKSYVDNYPNVNKYPNKWSTLLVAEHIENKSISRFNYLRTVNYLKNNVVSVMNKVEDRIPNETNKINDFLQKEYNIKEEIKLNKPQIIHNKDFEEKNYYGYVMLVKTDKDFVAVATTVMIYLYDKIITMNVYYKYTNKNDIDRLVNETRDWLNKIVELNNV